MTSIDELTAEVARLTDRLDGALAGVRSIGADLERAVAERDAAQAEAAKLRGELAEAHGVRDSWARDVEHFAKRASAAELAASRTRDAQQIRQEGAATAGTGKDDPIRFGAPGESPSPPLGDSPHARDAAMPGFDARSTAMGMYHATQAQEDDTAEALQRAFDAGRRTRDSGGEAREEAKCKNAPCPVCGDGPSGEWSEGSGVKCDGCGTDLVVDGCEPCLGSSWFSILGGKCPDCDGSGNAVKDDDDSPPCKPCDGEGYRELTVAEARAVAGLAAAPPATREAALPTKETKR